MKKLLYITLVVFLLACVEEGRGYAQTKKPDSLLAVYNNKSLADTSRLKAINEMAWAYCYSYPDTAVKLSELALQLAIEKKQKLYEAKSYNTMGVAYMNKGNYVLALENYAKALEIRKETGDKKGIGACYGNIGIIYQYKADYPRALEFYLKSLKIKEDINDKKGIAACYSNIGMIYNYQFNYVKSLEYQLKAVKMLEEIGDKHGLASAYVSAGNVYYNRNDFKKALEYYNKSLKIKESTGDVLDCYLSIGNVYYILSDFKKAILYYSNIVKIAKQTGDKYNLASCYNNIAESYKCLLDFKRSIAYSDSGLSVAKDMGDINMQRISYGHLSEAHARSGRYKEAYEDHVKYKQLTDSIFNADNSKQLGDLKTQFEVEKKEAELKIKAEAQEAISAEEKKKQQIIIFAVAGVLLLVIIFSLFLFNRFRITQRQKKVIEEQKVLVDKAYENLHEKNKEVMDSIFYARRIQRALITSEKYIARQLNRLMANK